MAVITDSDGQPIVDWLGRPILDSDEDPPSPSAQYAAVFAKLLPEGEVWLNDSDSTLSKILNGLAPSALRSDQRGAYLLEESPPGDSLIELLPEWESSLGLPDECAGQLPTIALRQMAVRTKLAARGGQSIPYFVGIASGLGIDVTVQEFTRSRFGRKFGMTFGGEAWSYTWRVTAPQTQIVPFKFGAGHFGEPFRTWGGTLLQCVLNRYKPAHTVLQIAYS